MNHEFTPDAGDDAMFDMLVVCCRWLAAGTDAQAFLDRMASDGPHLFAGVIAAHNPPPMPADQRIADSRRLFRLMGWSLLGAAPLPAHGFRPQRPPLPGRNEPCLCGSGAKFKQCCADLVPGLPVFEGDLLGALVIEALPKSRWATLPAEHAPARLVLGAAEFMLDDDRPADARCVLEPWSALPPPWPDERADLLDRLGDTYLDLRQPRKRKKLALDMVAHGGPAVQAKGWQRLSLLAADAGDPEGAQDAFFHAQRLQPDDPSLALLDVTPFMGAGDHDTARQRAAFHARRLARLPQADALAEAISALNELADPDSSLTRRAMSEMGEMDDLDDSPINTLVELATWLESLPAAKLRLELPEGPVANLEALRPNAALRRALTKWHAAFDFDAPTMAWDVADGDQALQALDSAAWMPLLRTTPMLADSFEVLDALMLVLQRVPHHFSARALSLVLGRALELWRLLRERQPQARCEWGWTDNRPALRLLAEAIDLDPRPLADGTFDVLRHLVEVLNPNDNHGFRERLAAVYLRRGELDAAARLVACYPDDGVGMTLLQARTRLAEGAQAEAAALVQLAIGHNRHLKKVLLASRAPRKPQVPSYAIGSAEEARIVIANQFDLWRDDPAVQRWLRGVLDGQAGNTAMPGRFD